MNVEDEAEVTGGTTGGRSSPGAHRERQIAEAAYYRAEQRGFAPGYEVDDWLAAEQALNGSKADS